MNHRIIILLGISLLLQGRTKAATPISDLHEDGNEGKAVTIEGIVTARSAGHSGSGLLFIQDNSAGIGVKISQGKTSLPISGNKLRISGKLEVNDGVPLLHPASADALTLISPTNKLPRVKLVSDTVMANPSGLVEFEGRYIVMTNQVFETGTPVFKTGDMAALNGVSGDTLELPIPPPLEGHPKPEHRMNLFGVLSRLNPDGSANDHFLLYPARFVPRNSKSVRQLATRHTCLTCHQINTPLIGPAYTLIGAKYRNDPQGIEKILEQINNGGSGKWGVVVMTPFKGLINEEEKQLLAHWIYEMRWDALLND